MEIKDKEENHIFKLFNTKNKLFVDVSGDLTNTGKFWKKFHHIKAHITNRFSRFNRNGIDEIVDYETNYKVLVYDLVLNEKKSQFYQEEFFKKLKIEKLKTLK